MKDRIAANGGVATATLGELRECLGAGRLGPYVLEQVATTLHQEGIDFFPEYVITHNDAPRQHHIVRLITLDPSSPIFKAMKAVQDPTGDGDAFLQTLVKGTATAKAATAQDKLERARGALADALAILDEPEDVDA